MILHTIGEGREIFPAAELPPVAEQRIAGGILEGAVVDGVFKPRRLITTNPEMYLRGKYAKL